MTDTEPTIDELANRIAELSPSEQRALLVALESEQSEGTGNQHSTRWESYCADHPYDPLCEGVVDDIDEFRSRPDHLTRLPDGGGCAETWEYLSAYRNAGER